MLLSFQRPSHLFWEGFPPKGAPGNRKRIPGRTDHYSAGTGLTGKARALITTLLDGPER